MSPTAADFIVVTTTDAESAADTDPKWN